MISKIFLTGKTFGETCRYVCEDLKQGMGQSPEQGLGQESGQALPQRAQVLDVEGVRGHDHRLMAADFNIQHQFRPEKEKPVFHGMLSFSPGERPGDETLVAIARKYLDEIGMTETQFAIVKHTDKAHLHLHIVANRVNNEGGIIGQGLIIERGIKAAQKLTREYELRPERAKNLEQTHLQALHEPDAWRYRLYQVIRESLPGCMEPGDLEKRLLERGVSMRYRYDRETGEQQGVSFRIGNYCFRGSQVDPAYSLKKLEQTLELQRQEVLKPLQRQVLKQEPGLGVEREQRPVQERERELGKGHELKQGPEHGREKGLGDRREQEPGHDEDRGPEHKEEHRLGHSRGRGRGR